MNTHSKLLIATLALGMSAGIATAQDEPRPPRGERPPREGGPGGPGGPGFGGQRPMMSPLIGALDANSDGVIDEREIANASAALKKLDKNGDGKLTMEELRPPRPEGFAAPGEDRRPGGLGEGRGPGGPGFERQRGPGGPREGRGPADRPPGAPGERPRRPGN